MSGMTGTTSQAPIITTGFLNTVNDALPFNNVGQISGSIVPQYPGAPGIKLFLSEDAALPLTDLTVRTGATTAGVTALNPPNASAAGVPLLGGVYMYVKVAAGATAANCVVGRIAHWDLSVAADAYQVYGPAITDNLNSPLIAGVFLNPTTLQAAAGGKTTAVITPGNYVWIQVAGRAVLNVTAGTGPTTATAYLIWDRVAANGTVTYAPISAVGFGPSVLGTAPNQTTAPLGDLVGIAERGNASATALPATGAGVYVVADLAILGSIYRRQ